MNTDNINQHNTVHTDAEQTDLQGKQFASLLDAHARRLSMRTLKLLDDGRARAVKAHAQSISGESVNKDGTLNSFSGNVFSGNSFFSWAQQHRIASTGLVLGAMIVGFVLVQAFGQQQVSDAFLLSADLPPEAFVDRGFEPILNDGKLEL